jgi:hypothetical protein
MIKILISKTAIVKWNIKNIEWYIAKGYKFTKIKDKFEVLVEHLTKGSHSLVKVKCDCEECKTIDTKLIIWKDYINCILKNNNKYYCKECALLKQVENIRLKRLANGISFEQWCIDNNKQDILNRWDYELNNCSPCDINYCTQKKYYFKCSRGLHKSELKNIKSYAYGRDGSIDCKACNSFAQWGIDNLSGDFLEKYWDYDKNKDINPWKIARCFSGKKVWIKCQEVLYHDSYLVSCGDFTHKNSRCSICNKSKGEKRCKEVFISKNFIEILQEEHDKLLDMDKYNNTYFISQKTFDGLIGLGGGLLSYDFYLPKYNLLIEYQGEFHDGTAYQQSKKDFEKQFEHDRRKKEYAKQHNMILLEIWYWDFDNIEEILENELYFKI